MHSTLDPQDRAVWHKGSWGNISLALEITSYGSPFKWQDLESCQENPRALQKLKLSLGDVVNGDCKDGLPSKIHLLAF